MFSSLANPETFDTWKAQYRHKFALLVLVYLLIPKSPPSSSSASFAIDVGDSLNLNSGTPSKVVEGRSTSSISSIDLPAVVGPSSSSHDKFDAAAPSDTPLTSIVPVREVEASKADAMPVKGSTLKLEQTQIIEATPPLSNPPAPVETALSNEVEARSPSSKPVSTSRSSVTDPKNVPVNVSECPIDFRGRPICPGVERPHPSFKTRSAELSSEFAEAVHEFGLWTLNTVLSIRVNISPFLLFSSLVHLLLIVQLLSLVVEDRIIRTGLANPLPADFPRAATFSKRMTRIKWRLEATCRLHWKSIVLLDTLIAGVGWVAWEARWGEKNLDGWLDVPFGEWFVADYTSLQSTSRKGPLRDLVLLEALNTMLTLIQPSKHLLPAAILPATLAPPTSLYPPPVVRPSSSSRSFPPVHRSASDPKTRSIPRKRSPVELPQLELDTSWLISLFVEVTSALVSLFQLVRCATFLPNLSLIALPPHIIFHTARGRVNTIVQARQNLLRTIECLHAVFSLFPENSSPEEALLSMNEPDWVCTICFEGAEDEPAATSRPPSMHSRQSSSSSLRDSYHRSGIGSVSRSVTVRAKCRLPCGHKYHAGCLTTWFHHQTFCPCCHAPVSASTPMSSPPPSHPNSPAQQPLFGLPQTGEEDLSDYYPAEVLRRRRGMEAAARRRSERPSVVDVDGEQVMGIGLALSDE